MVIKIVSFYFTVLYYHITINCISVQTKGHCKLRIIVNTHCTGLHSVIDVLALVRHWRFWSFGLKGGGGWKILGIRGGGGVANGGSQKNAGVCNF